MVNVNMDFLSNLGGVAPNVSDGTSLSDLTGSGGICFADMLKLASADIPDAASIVNQDTADTIVTSSSYDYLYNQLFGKLSGADENVSGLCNDYLDTVADMLNCSVPDYSKMSGLSMWNSSDSDFTGLLNNQLTSVINSINTDPKMQLMLSKLFGSSEQNPEDTKNAFGILDDMSDFISTGLDDDKVSLKNIVDNLSECVNVISSDNDYGKDTCAMAEMLVSLSYALNSFNLNISYGSTDKNSTSYINNAELSVKNTLENISELLSLFTGKENIEGKNLLDFLSNNQDIVKFTDFSSFGDISDEDSSMTEFSAPLTAFSAQMPDVKDATEQLKALSGDATASNDENPSMNPFEFNIYELQGLTVPDKADVIALAKTDIDSIQSQITEQISSKLMETGGKDGVTEMTIILKPESLGEVAVKIICEKGVVSIMLSAQNESVGNAMNERLSFLAENLTGKNVEIKNIYIVQPSDAGSQMGLDFTNQGFSHRENHSKRQNYSDKVNGIPEIDAEVDSPAVQDYINKEAKLWAQA